MYMHSGIQVEKYDRAKRKICRNPSGRGLFAATRTSYEEETRQL